MATDRESLFPRALTKQQQRAMLSFLWHAGPEGFDAQAYDSSTWEWGVRPWPTMENLCKKGLIERVRWWGPEEGNEYLLTDLGREYMRGVVAERRRATSLTVSGVR